MKFILYFLFSFCFVTTQFAADTQSKAQIKYYSKLEPVWSLEGPEIQNPESAYYDSVSEKIYISNVSGSPTDKDGKGWILSVGLDGRGLRKIVEGLNAPKGIRVHQGILWVSDIDEMVSVSLADQKIKKKIKIAGAKFLNDPAISSDGTVYVSDMLSSRIYSLKAGAEKFEIFAEGNNLEAPNGLLIEGDKLVVAAWGIPEADFSTKVPGHLYSIALQTKKASKITPRPAGNLDGLEAIKGGYLVTDWMAGKLYRISKTGGVSLLASGFNGAADLGYVPKAKLILLPRMNENKVSALKMP